MLFDRTCIEIKYGTGRASSRRFRIRAMTIAWRISDRKWLEIRMTAHLIVLDSGCRSAKSRLERFSIA